MGEDSRAGEGKSMVLGPQGADGGPLKYFQENPLSRRAELFLFGGIFLFSVGFLLFGLFVLAP
ncbi:hypothetical protein ITI46_26065 [Streptomyces oryzae]|uniref:Uncharacterized protein n=1 Tax=Streptomyces oryzae TaxID=1434886 RepID=A0ABS3XIG8_9ACTN|nr:hypothetical protein [Streptomyces oryzae]MBO8195091.1 hypothetical protein [Streptomyces oryzae]